MSVVSTERLLQSLVWSGGEEGGRVDRCSPLRMRYDLTAAHLSQGTTIIIITTTDTVRVSLERAMALWLRRERRHLDAIVGKQQLDPACIAVRHPASLSDYLEGK
jgi:hypothetical protein